MILFNPTLINSRYPQCYARSPRFYYIVIDKGEKMDITLALLPPLSLRRQMNQFTMNL